MSRRYFARPVLICCFAVSASAQDRPPLQNADPLVQKIFQRTASNGMVVAIVRDGEVWTSGYGRVAPGSDEIPRADSLVRLCSITKILATDLLAKLVSRRTVSFDDPLQKFAPGGVTVTTLTERGPARRPVNLGDLATHTAGMPREIAYPPPGAAHFTFPDHDFRWQWLPRFRLRTSPGDAAHYSNIGFDLLADALSTAAGKSYAELFQESTSRPLAMMDTTLNPSPEQCKRLMSGPREPSQCTDTEAAAGSGGMYSTAHDMAIFLRYLLKLPGVPAHQNGWSTGMYLQPANLRSVQGLGHAGVPDGIGLGWIEINKQYGEAQIIEKTGGGAGFQTYIALNPARHAGIFIARTDGRGRGGANMFREANNLLLTMVNLPLVPVDPADPERERTADDLKMALAGRHRGARAWKTGSRAVALAVPPKSRRTGERSGRIARASTKRLASRPDRRVTQTGLAEGRHRQRSTVAYKAGSGRG